MCNFVAINTSPQRTEVHFGQKLSNTTTFKGNKKKTEKKVFLQNSTVQICVTLLWKHMENFLETLTKQIERL